MAEGIEFAIRKAKQEVAADIQDGTVPPTVSNFSQLHDYVDANGYGGAFDWPQGESSEESDEEYVLDTCAFWNAVQHAVDAWIKAGRPSLLPK